jgi:hypothetical protein
MVDYVVSVTLGASIGSHFSCPDRLVSVARLARPVPLFRRHFAAISPTEFNMGISVSTTVEQHHVWC